MVNLGYSIDKHSLELFVLPGFRERTFPGKHGRLRSTPRVDTSRAEYDTSAENRHVDLATHYSFKHAGLDLGLYHFWGTSRDPSGKADRLPDGELVIVPQYPITHQTGTHLRWDLPGVTLKGEALIRSGQAATFFASVFGFERILKDVSHAGMDLKLQSEFMHTSSKDALVLTPFENDLFVAATIYPKDKGNSSIGVGYIADMNTSSGSPVILCRTELTKRLTLTLEYRGLLKVPKSDPVYSLRRDGFLELELTRAF